MFRFSKFKMFVTLFSISFSFEIVCLGYFSGISKFSKILVRNFSPGKWFSKGESQFSMKITHHPNSYFTRKGHFARSEWPRIYFSSRTISRTHFHRTLLSEPKNFLYQTRTEKLKISF